MPRPSRPSRGFVPIDVIMGIAILLVLLLVLTHTITMQRRATDRLADHRAATALAERAITALQAGDGTLDDTERRRVLVKVLDTDFAAEGRAWVEVRATVNGAVATLIGVAPRDRAERWGRDVR